MFLDIFFVLGMRPGLSKGDPAAFVVETAVFSQQNTDQQVHGRWVVGVDGCSAVEKENDHAADEIHYLSEPVDLRLVYVHGERKNKVLFSVKQSSGLGLGFRSQIKYEF